MKECLGNAEVPRSKRFDAIGADGCVPAEYLLLYSADTRMRILPYEDRLLGDALWCHGVGGADACVGCVGVCRVDDRIRCKEGDVSLSERNAREHGACAAAVA